MPNIFEMENIEELRREEGIDDVELRLGIRTLKAGDFVRVTFLANTESFETLLVRITSIRGSAFRGKLVKKPASSSLRRLDAGAAISFTTAHIHSLLKRADEPME